MESPIILIGGVGIVGGTGLLLISSPLYLYLNFFLQPQSVGDLRQVVQVYCNKSYSYFTIIVSITINNTVITNIKPLNLISLKAFFKNETFMRFLSS